MSHRLICLRDFLATSNLLDDDRVLVDWDKGIDIQVDWDGDPNNPGSFVVQREGTPTPVGRLSPGRDNEQLATSGDNKMTCVRVARGPSNPGVRFAAKLVRIEWLQEVPPSQHDQVVVRGTHYAYAPGVHPSSEPWWYSQEQDGVHHLHIELPVVATHGDPPIPVYPEYEMWVRLWHPDGSEIYQVQDPVLRTNGGGGPVAKGTDTRARGGLPA